MMNDEELRNAKRLLGAIVRHIDDNNLIILSKILVYHKGQHAKDIEALHILLNELERERKKYER